MRDTFHVCMSHFRQIYVNALILDIKTQTHTQYWNAWKIGGDFSVEQSRFTMIIWINEYRNFFAPFLSKCWMRWKFNHFVQMLKFENNFVEFGKIKIVQPTILKKKID